MATMPKAPRAPKAPKLPKADPKKAGAALGKKATGQVKKKFNTKRLLLILIPLLLLGIAALVVWLLMDTLPSPRNTVEKAINAAFIEDEDGFKALFSDDSIEALETAWSGADFGVGATRGSWRRMMKGILTADELKPKILEEAVGEDGKTAQVVLDVDGVKRTLHLIDQDGEWRLNVNLGIDPTMIVLPEEQMTEELAEEMRVGEPENEMWWEEREAQKAAEAEKKGGCLGCRVAGDAPAGELPLDGALLLGTLAMLVVARRRLRRGET